MSEGKDFTRTNIIAVLVTRIWRGLSSLRLAALLLALFVIVVLLGTVVPQMPSPVAGNASARAEWLAVARQRFGARAALYQWLGLFTVYRSPVFVLVVVLLALNTLVCTVNRLGVVWRGIVASPRVIQPTAFYTQARFRATIPADRAAADRVSRVLARRRYRVVQVVREGVTYFYADRGRWSHLAMPLVHLGVLVVVLAFAATRWAGWRMPDVVLPPGQVVPVGQGWALRSEDFAVERAPDGGWDYAATIAVLADEVEVQRETVRVNAPLRYGGVSCYLTSYGPAVRVDARDEQVSAVTMRVESTAREAQGSIVISFAGAGAGEKLLVPEYDLALDLVHHAQEPPLFVQVRRLDDGQLLAQGYPDEGEKVEVGGVRFTFTREYYPVLELVHDPGFGPAVAGASVMVMGLVLAFFVPRRRLWLRVAEDEICLVGQARRDTPGFEEEFARVVEALRQAVRDNDAR
ncbi:MAG: cytochrome c biogenesis protein ResB [Anaerolineae bacterium]|nr:cytochrome c biogenesis protein ResB [Anaerolineae bacterium]